MSVNNNRKVKVGVVGCGVVATAYYLPYLMNMDNVELIAVCDLYKERTEACVRLFGVKEEYLDYDEMIGKADIEAVFILTAPGTHAPFTIKAAEKGKHVLLQKPMATNMEDARAIAKAVREAGVKALVEPSKATALDPIYAHIRKLVNQGVLGDPSWFSYILTGPDKPHPSLGSNPFGVGAFFTKDSGGMLFDFPYAPTEIVSVLGPCKSVSGMAKISFPQDKVVPDSKYNEYISKATDPQDSNYWRAVVNEPRTQMVKMEAPDNVFSQYEMENGAIGTFHVGRLRHPVLKGSTGSGFQIFGSHGNLMFGYGYAASIISSRKELLPNVSDDGWYHIPEPKYTTKAEWPIPRLGGFIYYHESSKHFIDCIINDREPIANVDWGLHITEMMYGALEASRTGKTYKMTTTLNPSPESLETEMAPAV